MLPPPASINLLHRRFMSPMAARTTEEGKLRAARRKRSKYALLVSRLAVADLLLGAHAAARIRPEEEVAYIQAWGPLRDLKHFDALLYLRNSSRGRLETARAVVFERDENSCDLGTPASRRR